MSEQNIEGLKASYEAFATGNLESALAILDSQIAVSDHDRALDGPREYHGPQGVVQMAAEAAESFEDHRYEPEQFRDLGDQILVTTRRRGRGKASGADVDELQWHLWEFRGHKAVRLRTFVAEDDALEAAGLTK